MYRSNLPAIIISISAVDGLSSSLKNKFTSPTMLSVIIRNKRKKEKSDLKKRISNNLCKAKHFITFIMNYFYEAFSFLITCIIVYYSLQYWKAVNFLGKTHLQSMEVPRITKSNWLIINCVIILLFYDKDLQYFIMPGKIINYWLTCELEIHIFVYNFF